MSCTNPLLAYKFGINPDTGKSRLFWVPSRFKHNHDMREIEEIYGKDNLVLIPCGKCPACILTYRKNWSVRCRFEALCHLQNCFVTLTYDDEHYISNCANRKEDLQKFIHSLRDRGITIRYFACGEVGKNGRFHYHIIMFGYFPTDAKFQYNDKGINHFSSDYLQKVWNKGIIDIEEYNDACAEYVAGYVSKKSDFGKQNFLMFSTRPGLGYDWFISHREDMLKYGVLLGNNGRVSFLPKYASKFIEDCEEFEIQKQNKLDNMRFQMNKRMREIGTNYVEEVWNADKYKFENKLNKRRRKL